MDATADKKGDYESGALEAFESYATYAKKDILSLNSGKGNLTAGSQSDFSYNNDTTFVVVELKKELFNLRFQLATGQLQDTTAIVNTKRDIARAKTALRSLELKAQA